LNFYAEIGRRGGQTRSARIKQRRAEEAKLKQQKG